MVLFKVEDVDILRKSLNYPADTSSRKIYQLVPLMSSLKSRETLRKEYISSTSFVGQLIEPIEQIQIFRYQLSDWLLTWWKHTVRVEITAVGRKTPINKINRVQIFALTSSKRLISILN